MEKLSDIKKLGKGNQLTLMDWSVDYVAAEQNLETIGYFSARYARRALDEKQKSKVVVLSDSRRIEIVPSMKYGFPNAEDLDFYRAFLKICDEKAQLVKVEAGGETILRPRLPSPIGFSSRELIAKAGRTKNGRGHGAVRSWIERLNSTTIHGELFDASERKYDVRIGLEPLFRKYVHVGRPMPDGEIASLNFVWLADWFVENYFYLYSRPVDLKFHHRLTRSISKSLYPLLDNGWFAASGHPYTKRYTDLCTLLDIQAYQQLSRVQQQLDPSNEELQREKFIASYDYPADAEGHWTGTVRWWPGPKWIYDQEQRKRRKDSNSVQIMSEAITESLEDALVAQMALPLQRKVIGSDEAAYQDRVVAFYEKVGQSRPSKEKIRTGVETLRSLIDEQDYTLEDVDFAIVWIVEQLHARFGGTVQSIGLLPHIIGEALDERMRVEKKKRAGSKREKTKTEFAELEARNKLIDEGLQRLSDKERGDLRTKAVGNLSEKGIPARFLMDGMIKIEMFRLWQEQENAVAIQS